MLKYRPEYPHNPFDTLEDARAWVAGFVRWYNTEYRHSGTPNERHDGRENAVLAHRERVYERARRKNPNRWSGVTRNWSPAPAVLLNPKRVEETIAGTTNRSSQKGDI
jgi:putative transposase